MLSITTFSIDTGLIYILLAIVIVGLVLLVLYLLPQKQYHVEENPINSNPPSRKCGCGVVYRTDVHDRCPVCC